MRPSKDAPKDPREKDPYADDRSPEHRHHRDFGAAPQPRAFILERLEANEIGCGDPEARRTEVDEEGRQGRVGVFDEAMRVGLKEMDWRGVEEGERRDEGGEGEDKGDSGKGEGERW